MMEIIDYDDRKPLGRTGERVSAIGLGTWDIRDYGKAENVLVQGVLMGLDLIDTAELYDDGAAEQLVGRVVKRVGRENVFITTKLLPSRFTDPDKTINAMKKSLMRLGISTVDLVLIHWPAWMIPVDIQVRNLELLAMQGYTRYIGVSNFDKELLEKALSATRRHEIVADQVKYSVLDKWVEKDLLTYCNQNNVLIQAYTPLEKGRIMSDPLLREISRKLGKTPVQVALNYLISHRNVVAIPKTEDPMHLKEIHGTLGWRLSPGDFMRLKNY